VEILRISSRLTESNRADVLWSLGKYLPASQVREAFHVIVSMPGDTWDNLERVLKHLPEDLLARSLQIISALQSEWSQRPALASIAAYLPENLFREALQIIQKMESENCRTEALHEVEKYLPSNLMPGALDILDSYQDPIERSKALGALVTHFDWESTAFTRWSAILRDLTFRRRQDLIEDLPKLAPAILHYGNEDTLREVLAVMEDVCDQWR
ncbi:MAG: hypothetical protein AAFY17_10415, partial [Cyanobacteria bacterium J06642_11]